MLFRSRSAVRARSWSGEGFDAAERGRATGASIVTGGRFDCCASAPENEATAISPATAETFRPELLSNFSSTELIVAIERNDLGAFASPIPFAPLRHSNSLMRFICSERQSVGIGRKNWGQCDYGAATVESIQIKTILNLSLKSF